MNSAVRKHRVAAQWASIVIEQANRILALPPLTSSWIHNSGETINAPVPRSLQTGPGEPASPLDIARLFLLRIQTLGIVWFLTGDRQYRDRARQELLAGSECNDWNGGEFLVTAEMTCGAALGYDWLHDELTIGERQTIEAAILEKGLQPGRAQHNPECPAHWTSVASNWTLVCNAALMIGALAVFESDPVTTQELFTICHRAIQKGFDLYQPDGGWVEGPGYWHYATQYAVYLIDSLETAIGSDLELATSQSFGRTGFFRLHVNGPSGAFFNFADSEVHHSGGYWLLWLARRYRHPVDSWIERQRSNVHPMDLLWFDPNFRRPSRRTSTTHHFRGAQVVTMRANWDQLQSTYLGVKAGANDSCPHAHYDLGSFVFESQGVRWAIDLGPDNYNLKSYFDPAARLKYYRTNTLGHNTIVVDAVSQPRAARAPIITASFAPKLSYVLVDLTQAYPKCRRAVRGFAMINRRHVVIIDEIEVAEPIKSIAWQMHTNAKIDLDGADATLTELDHSGAIQRLYVHIKNPKVELSLADATPDGPSGQNPNTGVRKLVVALVNVPQKIRIEVFLSPEHRPHIQFPLWFQNNS